VVVVEEDVQPVVMEVQAAAVEAPTREPIYPLRPVRPIM